MTDPERPTEDAMEASFLAALPEIEAVIRITGRRRGMSDDEISDFASEVKLSMIQSRYRALARYEGRSSLATYLRTVIRRMLVDFRRSQAGKWRASACARRLGPEAVELERLIFRDGLTYPEAANVCATKRGDESVDDFMAMAQMLPVRRRRTTVSIEHALAELRDPSPLPDQARFLADISSRLEGAMSRRMAKLKERDRQLIRLRFEQGLCANEIGQILGLNAKCVYRRCQALLVRLREDLVWEGVVWKDVARTAGSPSWVLRWPDEPRVVARSPSNATPSKERPQSRGTALMKISSEFASTRGFVPVLPG